MSGNYKNISGYSASDLQKYWRGELSAREMHELEKAAQEDPFLADALEGMELHKALPEPAAFDRDLEELQARLENRIAQEKNKRTILLFRPWTRVAAAVLLLAGLSTAAYYTLLNRSGQMESAASSLHAPKDKAVPAAPASADSTAIKTDSAAVGALAATASNQPAGKKTGKEADKEKESAPSELATKMMHEHAMTIARDEARQQKADTRRATDKDLADTLSQSDRTMAKAEKEKAADDQSYLPAMRIAPRLPASAPLGNGLTIRKDTVTYNGAPYPSFGTASRSKQLPDHLTFFGIVLDEHDHPLPGASVYLNGRTTVTDQHGVFNLKLRPMDSALKVTVGYAGYQQTSIALNTLDQQNIIGNNIIRLQPQPPSLDEVVVIGYGTQRKETLSRTLTGGEEKLDSLWIKVTPVSGRLLYQSYLAAARKKLLLDSTIKGDEIISFDVNKKGELSSFKVEQSLSPAHDSSIIRLVREGPSWKLLRGRQARAAVRVSF